MWKSKRNYAVVSDIHRNYKHLIQTGEVAHGSVLFRAMDLCREETGDSVWYDVPDKYWIQAIAEMIGEAQSRKGFVYENCSD